MLQLEAWIDSTSGCAERLGGVSLWGSELLTPSSHPRPTAPVEFLQIRRVL